MRKIGLLLLLSLVALAALPARATDPNTNGTILTNVVNNQVTHCSQASQGIWAFNEFCAPKPSSSVLAAQIRLPGLPSGATKGCMWHGAWLMVFINPPANVNAIVINQPVEVIWLHETQSPLCKFVA